MTMFGALERRIVKSGHRNDQMAAPSYGRNIGWPVLRNRWDSQQGTSQNQTPAKQHLPIETICSSVLGNSAIFAQRLFGPPVGLPSCCEFDLIWRCSTEDFNTSSIA
jgi:hypothetical protein